MRFKIPDIFNLDRSEKYVLSIRLNAGSCSFALYDPLTDGSYFFQEVIYNKKISDIANFKDFFFDNDFLAFPYKKLHVISHSLSYTFIPSVIYEEKDKETIFDFNFSQRKGKILSQQLQRPELHIIYEMDNEMHEFLHRSLSNPQFTHHTSSLISFFYNRGRMGNNNKLIINVQKDSLDILCFSLDELILANSYSCKSTEDMIYYILFIWKHLKLNQLKDTAIITGKPEQRDLLMNILKDYIKLIVPFNIVPEHHFFGINISNVPFDQSSLSLCEL